ncbi:hypothetical protein TNCV_4313921 [Trichonephila clavipes]|nr:hypothetical protein TNCV_4313921 [Trichonephila clavipes]
MKPKKRHFLLLYSLKAGLIPRVGKHFLLRLKAGGQSKATSCFSLVQKWGSEASCLIDMETDQTFQLYLIKYQDVHISDFITFMTHFRIIVNDLRPPEIIDLHTETEKRIV